MNEQPSRPGMDDLDDVTFEKIVQLVLSGAADHMTVAELRAVIDTWRAAKGEEGEQP